MQKSNALFLTLLIAMALTAAGLILSIPPLFRSHEPHQVWITGILGCLALVFAVGTLFARPAVNWWWAPRRRRGTRRSPRR